MTGWLGTGVVALTLVAVGPQRLLAQDSPSATGAPARGPVTIGVGVEQFGVVLERLGAIHEGLVADSGRMMPTATVTVPISPRFAVQAAVAGHRYENITGEHTDVLYGFMINQRIGRLTTRRFQPFITYGLIGSVTHTAVPEGVEWVWNGTAWEERVVPPSTRRSHNWPSRPVGGAALQYNVWRGFSLRADAELIGPSAARVRASVLVPLGRSR